MRHRNISSGIHWEGEAHVVLLLPPLQVLDDLLLLLWGAC
jgi:hypothetical protein